MATTRIPADPRKTPVQRRSERTVGDIQEATVQVLIAQGINGLTTTRVAERAGVSVGTLYQYYPNKRSLVAAVLKDHLSKVVEAMEQACLSAKGGSPGEMADALVDAYFESKWVDPDASVALYAVSADVGADAIVTKLVQRVHLAVYELLATCPSACFDDVKMTGLIFTTSLMGPVQTLLATRASRALVAQARAEMRLMAGAYLERSAQPTRLRQPRNSASPAGRG